MNYEQEIDTRERLTRLWREAEPSVQAYVFATVRRVHDAEDVVQQVAMTVARRFDEYDRSRPFVAWALWLAKSRIIDHYRKQEREKLVFSESLLERLAEALIQQQPQRGARQEALERCIEKLPEKSRQLLERRYVDDASMEGVAEAVQSTAASVRVMLYRVRNLLAECVQSELSRES
jgi:RNA polymerase sigma-70 factor, ECF subfamily